MAKKKPPKKNNHTAPGNRDFLARAHEIAQLGSWELDLVEGRLTWSEGVYRIFGLDPKEFKATYEAFLDNIHPDDRERSMMLIPAH
ncbi:MAG: PAS domain-containing protein [Desulfosalsimonas sp.]